MRWKEEDRAAKCINSCSTVEKHSAIYYIHMKYSLKFIKYHFFFQIILFSVLKAKILSIMSDLNLVE